MSSNPGLLICGALCIVPMLASLAVVLLFRSLAKRRITMNIEQTSIPLPQLPPDHRRLAIYFDLEERRPKENTREEDV